MKNKQNIKLLYSTRRQKSSKPEVIHDYSQGITKSLLAKYKPSLDLRILKDTVKNNNNKQAA